MLTGSINERRSIVGDSELEVNDYCSAGCSFADERQDCDGDWDTYCTKSGDCQYQDWKRDCDGDCVVFCRV